MSLEEKINADIKTAMLAKDKDSLNALRAVKSAILLLKTEKGGGEVTEEMEIKTLQRLVKQRKESAEMYQSQNRPELYEEEVVQMKIISQYLPQSLSEEEITADLKKMIAETGVTDIKGMGKLMGMATKHFAGRADNQTISTIIKTLLS
ncbi:MAG: GatB/YqeY domain-containing protein [Bacteroidales bacterium]|jgi:uncharacterized protein YqeY|nr:GatB/YqeY domain-containing protein [Bacteroidales bacterium]